MEDEQDIQQEITGVDFAREGITPTGVGRSPGQIDFLGDEDYFIFSPEPNRQYQVIVDSNVDTLLGVYDSFSGALLNADDDDGAGVNPQIDLVTGLNPDALVFQVDAAGNGEPTSAENATAVLATYDLLIFDLGPRPDPIEDDPAVDDVGDSLGESTAIGLNNEIQESIETAGDIDAYRILFEQGRAYSISLEARPDSDIDGQGPLDAFLQVIDSQGQLLLENSDRQEGTTDAGIVFAPEVTDFYFLSASDFDLENGTGAYELVVNDIGPAELPESPDSIGDDLQSAAVGELFDPITNQIETNDDVDVFLYTLVAGDTYQFDAISQDGLLNPALALVNSNGDTIATDNDGGSGANAQIVITPEETLDVYAIVGGFEGNSVGQYSLLAGATDVRAASTFEVQEIALLYEAGLDRDGDIDFDGLNFWIDQSEGGLSIDEISGFFLNSDEFQEDAEAFLNDGTDLTDDNVRDPDVFSNDDFIIFLYENVLDRMFDQEGFDFWSGILDGLLADPDEAGTARESMLLFFARSGENVNSSPFIEDLQPVSDTEWDFVVEA